MSTGKYGICGWLVRRVAGGLWGVLVEIAVGVALSGTRVAGPSYDLLLLVVPRCCSARARWRVRRALTFCVVAVAVRGGRTRL
ncbi:hypothetical protein [Streptomyces chromofuscus]|uniref:Uncharacterized protein n=1 Tax=Streptomyces chromofuscus TaxID=42881 RepID=A0A7M2T2M8_STRCW|nr:hypothetical protein [Streptomyces chromofuscus]QOV42429.1 hypothetical protein IPT68_21625 [Streptomyces chromofuscus]GGT27234.1 hypothetical protein GCM10010254_54770 [Streptomyces chromofuscus]